MSTMPRLTLLTHLRVKGLAASCCAATMVSAGCRTRGARRRATTAEARVGIDRFDLRWSGCGSFSKGQKRGITLVFRGRASLA